MPPKVNRSVLDGDHMVTDRHALSLLLPILKEVHYRSKHPMYVYVPDDDPERDQVGFHSSTAMNRMLFGGNQAGKSKPTAHEIGWWLCGNHPYQPTPAKCRIYCLSASYRTIQEGVYKHLKEIVPKWEIQKEGQCVPGWEIPQFIRMKN